MDGIDMKVSEGLVKPIVEAKIQAAIAVALGGEKQIFDSIVEKILTQKVNSEGKVDSYSHHNKYSFVEILCHKTIQAAADRAIRDWIEKNQKKLQVAIEKQLNKQSGKMTRAFIDGILDSIKSSWTFSCKVNLD